MGKKVEPLPRGTAINKRIVLGVSKPHRLANKVEYQVLNTCGCVTYRTRKALKDAKAGKTGMCVKCYRKIHSQVIAETAKKRREEERKAAARPPASLQVGQLRD